MNTDRKEIQKFDDYISLEKREHLLNGLHRYLIWVGEVVPEEVEVDGKNIKLHELIWDCIHKKKRAFATGEKSYPGTCSAT